MSQMLSTKEAAAEIGTDARTLRKFIRSDSCSFDAVGQGKRYEFSKKDVNQLKKAFLAWSGGNPSKKVNGTKIDPIDSGVEEQDEVDLTTEEVDLDDNDEPVDLEDLEPSDEEILQEMVDEIEDIELD